MTLISQKKVKLKRKKVSSDWGLNPQKWLLSSSAVQMEASYFEFVLQMNAKFKTCAFQMGFWCTGYTFVDNNICSKDLLPN